MGLSAVPTMSLLSLTKPDLISPGLSMLPIRLLPPEVKSPLKLLLSLFAIILLVIVAEPVESIASPPEAEPLLVIVLLVT